MKAAPLLAAALALSGCTRLHLSPAKRQPLGYVIGPPYAVSGVYQYPRADFEYDATGLAVVIGPHPHPASDGEAFDATALVGAHPTLQLPCVARVTNLDNGRQLLLRLNDRGPLRRGRLLGLSRRAAELLGMTGQPGGVPVRVQVEATPSRQLAAALDRESPLALTAAPTAAVQVAPLPPLSGPQATPDLSPGLAPPTVPPMAAAEPMPRLRLPEQVAAVPVRTYALFVLEAEFGRRDYAALLARRTAALGARVQPGAAASRDRAWRVVIGPLDSVAQADTTLDQAIVAGVVGANIVAE